MKVEFINVHKHSGKVIGTVITIRSEIKLVVACEDNIIRTCSIGRAKIIKKSPKVHLGPG